jgi:hypothetical protein
VNTRSRGRDAGRVSVFLAIAFFGVLAVIGVAADVPGLWRAMLHASNVAIEAARAGGQAIDVDHTAGTGEHRVDPAAAAQAAHEYLDAAGLQGSVEVSEDLTEITVTVTYEYQPQVLGLFGMPPRELSATHTAALLTG